MNKAISNVEINEERKILASYNDLTITIYQAYNTHIADEALRKGTFGSHFKMDRMTWIKPSFLWMMYRSGWATKEGRERILAIDITRTGFDTILDNIVLSSFNGQVYESYEDWRQKLERSEVRCQWDPDKDIHGNDMSRRAIQLGLKGKMVKHYVDEWIVKMNDITDYVTQLKEDIKTKEFDVKMLPGEQEYPLDEGKKKVLGIIR